MSSMTRLLVLGVVKLFQPVHGYEVRRELISWRAQEWASVQPGSIYNALKTLAREGYVEVASTDQVGGRPERTTYRLTPAGVEEFRALLREEWWTVRPPIDPLMAAISFLGEVSRAEAIAALEHRATHIRGMLRHTEFAIDAHDGTDSPFHVREMMRLMNARVSAELAWSQQFIARLRNDEYVTADDPPWQPTPRPERSGVRPARRALPPEAAATAAGRRRDRTAASAPARPASGGAVAREPLGAAAKPGDRAPWPGSTASGRTPRRRTSRGADSAAARGRRPEAPRSDDTAGRPSRDGRRAPRGAEPDAGRAARDQAPRSDEIAGRPWREAGRAQREPQRSPGRRRPRGMTR